jgi:hypothetical protein
VYQRGTEMTVYKLNSCQMIDMLKMHSCVYWLCSLLNNLFIIFFFGILYWGSEKEEGYAYLKCNDGSCAKTLLLIRRKQAYDLSAPSAFVLSKNFYHEIISIHYIDDHC